MIPLGRSIRLALYIYVYLMAWALRALPMDGILLHYSSIALYFIVSLA